VTVKCNALQDAFFPITNSLSGAKKSDGDGFELCRGIAVAGGAILAIDPDCSLSHGWSPHLPHCTSAIFYQTAKSTHIRKSELHKRIPLSGWKINGTTEFAKSKIDTFYTAVGANGANLGSGANTHTALVMGAAFKGFDDYEANWGTNRILTQGCGTTLLDSIAEPKAVTGANLPYMMVETWDDYEEGTEVETGVSNCLSDSSFILNNPVGATLTFSFEIEDGTPASGVTFSDAKNTIAGFNVWATGTDPMYYSLVGTEKPSICNYRNDNPINANCTIDLTGLSLTHGLTYNLLVQAVGQPMITNHISNNVVLYTP